MREARAGRSTWRKDKGWHIEENQWKRKGDAKTREEMREARAGGST